MSKFLELSSFFLSSVSNDLSAQVDFLSVCNIPKISFSKHFHMPWKGLALPRMDRGGGQAVTLTLSAENSTSGRDHHMTGKANLPKLMLNFTWSVGSSVHLQKNTVQEGSRYLLKSCCLQCSAGVCGWSVESSPDASQFLSMSYLTSPADRSCKMHIPPKAGFQQPKPKEIPIPESVPAPTTQNK